MWPEDEAGLSEPVAAHKTQSRQTHTKKKEEEEEEEGERNQSHQRKAKKTTRQTLNGDSHAARVGRGSCLTFDFLPVGSLCHELYVLHLFLLCFLHIFGCAALCSLAQHGQP